MGDDDELNDHQDDEADETDDEVSAEDELPECLDDVASGSGSEDEFGCGDGEGDAKKGRDNEEGGENGEVKGFFDIDRSQHDDDAGCHGDDQAEVKHEFRKRKDEHGNDEDHAHPENEVGVLEKFCEDAHRAFAGGVVVAYWGVLVDLRGLFRVQKRGIEILGVGEVTE